MAKCGCGSASAGPIVNGGAAGTAAGSAASGGGPTAAGYFAGLKPLCKKCFSFWVGLAVVVVIIYIATRKGK
jgi:hypothetical protein